MTDDQLRPLPPEQPQPGGTAPAAQGSPAGAGPAILEQDFDAGSLYALRSTVAAHASEAGLPPGRIDDLVIVVHELAANAVRHGAGHGQVCMWVDGRGVNCQVSDHGPERGDGQGKPVARLDGDVWESSKGHGLWLVRHLADHTSVRHGGGGTTVAVSFGFRPG